MPPAAPAALPVAAAPVGDTVDEAVAARLPVAQPLVVVVLQPVAVGEARRESLGDGVDEEHLEALPDWLAHPEPVRLYTLLVLRDGDAVPLTDAVGVGEGRAEVEGEGEGKGVREGRGEALAHAVSEPPTPPPLTLGVPVGLSLPPPPPANPGVRLPLAQSVLPGVEEAQGEAVLRGAVMEALGQPLPVPVTEGDAVLLPSGAVALTLNVAEGELLVLALGRAVRLCEPEGVAQPEALAVRLCEPEGVAQPEAVAVRSATEGVGVTDTVCAPLAEPALLLEDEGEGGGEAVPPFPLAQVVGEVHALPVGAARDAEPLPLALTTSTVPEAHAEDEFKPEGDGGG